LVFLQLSSSLLYCWMQSIREHENSTAGKITLFDMANPGNKAEELTIDGAGDFKLVKPDGVTSWTSSTGACVFVNFVSRSVYKVLQHWASALAWAEK